MKAVSYLRVSGKGQVDGDGFPRQREAIARYARQARIELVDEFRDEGVSGGNELENREGLAALLDRIESNGVRVVLIERADRLARDLMVGEVILSQLQGLGVRVLDASGNDLADDSDPTRKMVRQILGAIAEFDRNVTVAKLRAARDRNSARKGARVEGRKPFGFRASEAGTVELILALRRKPRGKPRMSYQAIASELNNRAIPTRTGAPWHYQTVRNIILRGGAK